MAAQNKTKVETEAENVKPFGSQNRCFAKFRMTKNQAQMFTRAASINAPVYQCTKIANPTKIKERATSDSFSRNRLSQQYSDKAYDDVQEISPREIAAESASESMDLPLTNIGETGHMMVSESSVGHPLTNIDTGCPSLSSKPF
ncbi:hypothetical protein DdX_21442 [Ditylenchus destructor]|uniref:Uncharacterized protein n=1 Tax=Ditylenchus destructor TaxID=166010 RepID=A0AAD4QVJ6_9BILA|nr:hypothetical protein DdX_21442 [Ditylenchus destructor]